MKQIINRKYSFNLSGYIGKIDTFVVAFFIIIFNLTCLQRSNHRKEFKSNGFLDEKN